MRLLPKSAIETAGGFLSAASVIYGWGVKLRTMLYQQGILKARKLPCVVISIGNITAGGTGKTPMTIYLTTLLKKLGYSVAIVSRGYRGKAEKQGGIVSNGSEILMTPEEAGDEPFMMAQILKDVPVLVGGNRFASGMTAIRQFKPDIIVLDDAFQHLRLHRDINLVLLDSRNPFGNGYMLPKGRLREPLSALDRADAFILTRSGSNVLRNSLSLLKRPIFRSVHVPRIRKNEINHRRVFAFSGIADNQDFLQTIRTLGGEIVGFKGFADHYPYSLRDLEDISASAKTVQAEMLVTTEKDHARIADNIRALQPDLAVIGIDISFKSDALEFEAFIQRRIAQYI
jgi:tetraacyldisaccharide 4'-kinase